MTVISKMTSNKPYLIRAIYDWIIDNNLTPYILVNALHPQVEVPQQYVTDGRIVLNISPDACRGLHLDNHKIVFSARFGGITSQVLVYPVAVLAIYAKENGRGMEFGEEYDVPDLELESSVSDAPTASAASMSHDTSRKKPKLTLVKKDDLDE